MTAEEFLQNHLQISHFYDDKTNQMVCYSDEVQQAMIEFEGDCFRVWHGKGRTFIAYEDSLEWFETYYFLLIENNIYQYIIIYASIAL
jgi:hypothetical protein